MLEELIPVVQALINDQVKKEDLQAMFTKLYPLLPDGFRLKMNEETFVKTCMEEQDKIFDKPVPTKFRKGAGGGIPRSAKRRRAD